MSFAYIYSCIHAYIIWILHSVHVYTGVPLPPIIENVTVGATWINLTWDHNESCCRNGEYVLLWQQWQSDSASDDMKSSKTLNRDRQLSITSLKPGTTYTVTLSVKCLEYEQQNTTMSVNTSIGKFMYALEYIHTKVMYELICVVLLFMYIYATLIMHTITIFWFMADIIA